MIRKIHTDLALFVLSFAEVSVFNSYTTDKPPFRKIQVMNSEVKLVRRLLVCLFPVCTCYLPQKLQDLECSKQSVKMLALQWCFALDIRQAEVVAGIMEGVFSIGFSPTGFL
jgi:hypothetical protein